MKRERGLQSTVPGGLSPIAVVASVVKQAFADAGQEAAVDVNGLCVEVRRLESTVVLTLTSSLAHDPLRPYMERLADGLAGLLLVGPVPDKFLASLPEGLVVDVVHEGWHDEALYLGVNGVLERVELKQHADRRNRALQRYRYELGELVEIARALSEERDIGRLLELILTKSRFITGADAGSIYVVEHPDDDTSDSRLRFKLSQNASCEFESSEFTMPVSMSSIAGAAAVTRLPITIEDVYTITGDAPYGFDKTFDAKVGYRTRSTIAVPMISAQHEVIGVIQLINRKEDSEQLLKTAEDVERHAVPFGERDESLLETLASQAGIALENAMLYDEIHRIFEGFVRASVQAIEQRDPTTSGHSQRVSVFSRHLAEVVDGITEGTYASVSFSRREMQELEYASLLHDFGKIGVREQVLVKAKKLYPHEFTAIRSRFGYVKKCVEAEGLRRQLELMRAGADARDLTEVEDQVRESLARLDRALEAVQQANEPTVLSEGEFSVLDALTQERFTDLDGDERPLLSAAEVASLHVMRGSLNTSEIGEIRSHVVHTFNFLSQIPWGKTMAAIPRIAGAHHEKLDGSGYPRGLTAKDIPLQSRIMTIADIYDALTARDRPYKKAIPPPRALEILGYEVKDGHVEAELVELFTEAKIYEAVQPEAKA